MITEYSGTKGLTKAELCEALGVARSSYYRSTGIKLKPLVVRKPSPRKLSEDEEQKILDIVNSDRFCDMAPGEIFHNFSMKVAITALSVQSTGYLREICRTFSEGRK